MLFYMPVCYYNMLLPILLAYYYATVYVPFIIREFRIGRNDSCYQANAEFRTFGNLIKFYRCIQIIQLELNQTVGNILVPLQAALTLLFVFTAFTLTNCVCVCVDVRCRRMLEFIFNHRRLPALMSNEKY